MESFALLLDLCVGNSRETGGFSSQMPSNVGFDIFVDVSRQNTE